MCSASQIKKNFVITLPHSLFSFPVRSVITKPAIIPMKGSIYFPPAYVHIKYEDSSKILKIGMHFKFVSLK